MNEQIKTVIAELRDRYAPTAAPPCRICGGGLSLERAGGGNPSVWRCAGRVEGGYAPGRKIADQHYEDSEWTDYKAGGDQRVIDICDALEAAERRAEEAEELYRSIKAKVGQTPGDGRMVHDAIGALMRRAEETEAQLETSRAEFAVLMDHSTRNVQILNDISTQTCCVHFEQLPEAVRELVAELHAAEARAKEDEQLRLRLAGDLALEQRQHELAREQLREVYREVDGLRAERASVDAGVCQSCASAWWAREHDQNAAREQVAAAEAALRAERARASAAQVVTNAAVRDLTSAAGEITLLREKLAAAEQDRDEVVTLLGEIRELARTRSQGPAVPDDLWAIKELADSFILRNAAPPGAAPAEAP